MEKCAPYMEVLFRVDCSVTQSRQWWSCEENLVFPISFCAISATCLSCFCRRVFYVLDHNFLMVCGPGSICFSLNT